MDHKANISAADLQELGDAMRLFAFDLLGLKDEKGQSDEAREEAYGKVVEMVLICASKPSKPRIGLPATRSATLSPRQVLR